MALENQILGYKISRWESQWVPYFFLDIREMLFDYEHRVSIYFKKLSTKILG